MAGELVIPDGFGQATIKWQVLGRVNPISCTIGFAKVTSGDTLAAIMHDMFSQLTTTGSICAPAAMDSQFTFESVSCVYNSGGTLIGAASDQVPVSGTVTSADPMIIGNSFIIRKRTGFVGRQYRGRLYFPIMYGGEGNVDYLGNVDPSIVTAFNTKIGVWTALVFGGTSKWIPNILHHVPKSGTTPVPTPISAFQLEGSVGTQRRRLR